MTLTNKIHVPPIKSQGIKTKLVPWIKLFVPEGFSGKWIEPCMGTGCVGFNVSADSYLMCDTNPHLINFYNAIKSGEVNELSVRAFLVKEGNELAEKGKEHFYEVRKRFNEEASPFDFLFVNRSCFNGMMRFNRKGGFNVPFCHKPNRFSKSYVTRIANQVSYLEKLFDSKDFKFKLQSFEDTIASATNNDIVYCDPPYIGRHVNYFNGWDEELELLLFNQIAESNVRFILSTWHHNDFRKNEYIEKLWRTYEIYTREHFYHVGGKEKNRNPMIEAIVTNLPPREVLSKPTEVQRDFDFEALVHR